MSTKHFALIIGISFLAAGILGFIPGFTHMHHDVADRLSVDASSGYLLGLFPVNALHNLVHILIGVWGLIAARDSARARTYSRGLALIYGVLAILGFIPGANTMFGMVPLWGHDIWLHAVTAAAGAYFGWIHSDSRIPVRHIRSDQHAV